MQISLVAMYKALTRDHCLHLTSSCCPVQSRPWLVSCWASGCHQWSCGCSCHTCHTARVEKGWYGLRLHLVAYSWARIQLEWYKLVFGARTYVYVFIPCCSILREQWSRGDGLRQTSPGDRSLCPADCRTRCLSPWFRPCRWKVVCAPSGHSANTICKAQTSVNMAIITLKKSRSIYYEKVSLLSLCGSSAVQPRCQKAGRLWQSEYRRPLVGHAPRF